MSTQTVITVKHSEDAATTWRKLVPRIMKLGAVEASLNPSLKTRMKETSSIGALIGEDGKV